MRLMVARSSHALFVFSAGALILALLFWYGSDAIAQSHPDHYFAVRILHVGAEYTPALVTAFKNAKAETHLSVRLRDLGLKQEGATESHNFYLFVDGATPKSAAEGVDRFCHSMEAEFARRDLPELSVMTAVSESMPIYARWADALRAICHRLSWLLALSSLSLLVASLYRMVKESPPPLKKEIEKSRFEY